MEGSPLLPVCAASQQVQREEEPLKIKSITRGPRLIHGLNHAGQKDVKNWNISSVSFLRGLVYGYSGYVSVS